MSSKINRSYAFTGATGFRNRGVEALIATAITEIREMDNGAQIGIVSNDPDYDAAAIGTAATVIRDNPSYYRMSDKRRTIRYAFGLRTPPAVRRIQTMIGDADVVIATGGDIFSSDYGVGFLRRQLALVREAQQAGKKTVFLAHSIGPFRSQSEIDLIKPVLEASSLITARETFTHDYLAHEIGLGADKVTLTADVAFLMKPADDDRIALIKRLIGLAPDQPYIVLAPSEGITSFETSDGISNHDEAWLSVIRHLLDTTSADIVLLPHVQDTNVKNDDYRIVSRLLSTIGMSPRVHAAFGPYSAMDFKGLVKGADLLIGERMHACIAGLSQNVPTFTIGYSVKAAGIMTDILGDQVAQRKLLIAVQEFTEGDDLNGTISGIWNSRADIRKLLEASTPNIKARAADNFRRLAEI